MLASGKRTLRWTQPGKYILQYILCLCLAFILNNTQQPHYDTISFHTLIIFVYLYMLNIIVINVYVLKISLRIHRIHLLWRQFNKAVISKSYLHGTNCIIRFIPFHFEALTINIQHIFHSLSFTYARATQLSSIEHLII